MTSVWKRLQRVGKRASKFQFVASFEELTLESTKKWQPDKVRVMWIRRNRRHSTKLHSWQPGIKNPYRGLIVWQVPETLNINVTLFKEPTAEEFEDKDWTFVIENETKGRRKVLASADVNMKKYASSTPAQYDITLKLKPLSVKVVEATLKLNLSCIFLKEGKATDEDMQSLASLMSMKQSDVGNLDDFNDSDDEVSEDRRLGHGTGQAAHVAVSTFSAERLLLLVSRPEGQSGLTVPSEKYRKSSTGISSSTPCKPPDPSTPPLSLEAHRQPSSSTQQDGVANFSRSHPPTLPRIFRSYVRSVRQRPHSFHSDAFPAEGLASQPLNTLVPSKALSTSALCPPPCETSLHSSALSQTAPLRSSPSIRSAARPPKAPPPPVGVLGSALTRPSSLPSAPERASWQTEWRPPKSQTPLSQPALSPKFLHFAANVSGQTTEQTPGTESTCNAAD